PNGARRSDSAVSWAAVISLTSSWSIQCLSDISHEALRAVDRAGIACFLHGPYEAAANDDGIGSLADRARGLTVADAKTYAHRQRSLRAYGSELLRHFL